MVSRRAHRTSTLLRLSDAAVELFETNGPDVTIDEIATRADVSRRTVFRYVDRKEDLAFIHPVLWLDVFEDALTPLSGQPLVDRLRIASRAIAEHIDTDPGPPHRAFSVVAVHPELVRGFTDIFQRWVERVADETLRDLDRSGPHDRFRARIIGSAVMGMVDAVTREWVLSYPDVGFLDLYDEGFALLAPIIEAGSDAPTA